MGNKPQYKLFDLINEAEDSPDDKMKIKSFLKRFPNAVDEPITEDNVINAIGRAAFLGKTYIVQILISCGANVNATGSSLISALMWAARQGHIETVKFLLDFQADATQTDMRNLNALDFAILYGKYEVALLLKKKGVKSKHTIDEYLTHADALQLFYVNYKQFLEDLNANTGRPSLNYFEKPSWMLPPKLQDPVNDPNEDWGSWFNRTLNWEFPPEVERSSLPAELQPQNTMMGKVKIAFGIDSRPLQMSEGDQLKENEQMKRSLSLAPLQVIEDQKEYKQYSSQFNHVSFEQLQIQSKEKVSPFEVTSHFSKSYQESEP